MSELLLGAGSKMIVKDILRRITNLSADEKRYLLELMRDEFGEPDIGVREPLVPYPTLGSDAIALDEPGHEGGEQ